MAAGFRDHFSRDAGCYAKFRPRYPPELFEWVSRLPAERRVAWDCATGNGQAATILTRYFPLVLGSDASRAQLQSATVLPGVHYLAGLAEQAALARASVDLVTVAQALHWFDAERFYSEVARVAAPGAALAVWGYGRVQITPEIDAVLNHFHDVTVGPCWDAPRKLVDEGYRSFRLPIEEVNAPGFAIHAELSLSALLGYLRTWSAVGKYLKLHGADPVAALAPELALHWGDPAASRPAVWPLFLRAGRVRMRPQ